MTGRSPGSMILNKPKEIRQGLARNYLCCRFWCTCSEAVRLPVANAFSGANSKGHIGIGVPAGRPQGPFHEPFWLERLHDKTQ